MVANTRTKYESDTGDIHPIVLKPDTASVAGTAPSGTTTSSIKVKVSKSRGEYGIRPRGVVIAKTVGTAPNTFSVSTFIPVLTPAAYNVAPFVVGNEITYKGVAHTVISLRPEDIN